MVEINWTREAQVWLRDVHSYIALDNPDAAQRTMPELLRELNSSKPILDSDTRTRRKGLAKYVSFNTAIIESHI